MTQRDMYVYVANRLSGYPGEYLANVAEMSNTCRRLTEAGYVVINPAGDALQGLMSEEPLPEAVYRARSLGLLRLCIIAHQAGHRAALLVVHAEHRDGSMSAGVSEEIRLAREHWLPVCWSESDLHALRGAEA